MAHRPTPRGRYACELCVQWSPFIHLKVPENFVAIVAELDALRGQVEQLQSYTKQLEGYSQRIVLLAERTGFRPRVSLLHCLSCIGLRR